MFRSMDKMRRAASTQSAPNTVTDTNSRDYSVRTEWTRTRAITPCARFD